MLMQLTVKDQVLQIQKYGEKAISAFLVEWTLFYQDLSPPLEYIILDVIYATEILIAG